ncbi:alpha-mannosidase [Mucisphaera calidilacus]|uniref:Mannosylglycerate hydrolase n=1 Tax=Mucisphaera calidilacus TaxID=2527982 RepID=A0A518BTY6_9BACT|nr:alpha-mannosidase [Mucisphaera calidilacus]QDU70429.1 Mannosylglycerate hydrolase [Mucisphaera calidilacus]
MLETNPFPQFDLPRLARAKTRLEEMIWRVDPSPLAVSQSKPTRDHVTFAEAKKLAFKPVKRTPRYWGKVFDQCWWRVEIPKLKGDEQVYLLWRDRGEATLYADGEPVYGIDPGHHFAPLRKGVKQWMVESACCRTGIWVPGETQGLEAEGSRFEGAFLAYRDDEAWGAFHDFDVLIQLLDELRLPDYPSRVNRYDAVGYKPELHAAEPTFRWMLERMSRSVDALDREGVGAMRKVLAEVYRGLQGMDEKVKAVLTGHAHIDLVWLWPERVGEFKAIHTFSNTLSILEQYPEFRFGYSQPASYQAVERRCPSLMKRVRAAIDSGAWEATGAMQVESDTQLPCGEALVRAVAFGQRGFKEVRGEASRVLWLPDVFGYSGCVPQILAGFGVPYFFTTKLHWSTGQRFPYTSFRWMGHDGSEVLAHVIWNHYNMEAKPQELIRLAEHHRQAAVHDEFLVPTGFGDGGGGATEGMLERARRIKDLRGVPNASWGGIEPFFDRMAEKRDALPAWRGEMYLEFHRGVQTTQCALKNYYRRAERQLQVLEAVHAVKGMGPVDPVLWERVLFAQFHDYLPGSSVREVYDEAVPELASIGDVAEKEAAGALKGRGKACVFNPLAQPMTAAVNGAMRQLPPLSGVEVDSLDAIVAGDVKATKRSLVSERVEARFDAKGCVVSLVIDGEMVPLEGVAAEPWVFPDQPAMYNAWDVDRPTLAIGEAVSSKAEVVLDDSDGLMPRLSFTRRVGASSEMTVSYSLDPVRPVLHMDVEVDWQDRDTLLKLVFPTGYCGKQARYGAPFGSALRGQSAGPLANEAMFENPGSRWVTVSDDTEADGFMVVTERTYGFGVREGQVHVSLVRSPRMGRSGDAPVDSEGRAEHDYADLGRHHFRLAVGRFTADAVLEEQPAALADLLYAEPIEYRGGATEPVVYGVEGLSSVVPSWVKPEPGGGMTVRLQESLGRRGWVSLDLGGRSWHLTDLAGTPVSEATTHPCAVEVKPYQIISVRVG